jgi:hypothetical protein
MIEGIKNMVTLNDIAPELRKIADMIKAGRGPLWVAFYIQNSQHPIALSHYIEDKAEPGTFAAAVFDILCNW